MEILEINMMRMKYPYDEGSIDVSRRPLSMNKGMT